MNAIRIISKELARVDRALKRSVINVERQRGVMKEAEREHAQFEKRLRQLEEARTVLLAEQEKTLKAAGITVEPARRQQTARIKPQG